MEDFGGFENELNGFLEALKSENFVKFRQMLVELVTDAIEGQVEEAAYHILYDIARS